MLREFTVLLLFMAAGYKPEWNFEKDSKQKTTVAETKEKEEPADRKDSQESHCGTAAKKEQKGNFWLTLLRYTGIDCTDCGGSYSGCLWHF